MALTKYKSKRSFTKTPEPTGGKSSEADLKFVIQKHNASHLHYDFRLEMESVLKSWAVPKGPSTDTSVKRLAMMVEDHPYDYRNFEGIIPKGQYGGGTVIVWDEGTYVPADAEKGMSKKEMEKMLLHGIHAGKLHFIMKGKKMKGEWALVKTHGRGENAWLLMKINDRYASDKDITKKDKSVISGKTIPQMEAEPDKVYGKAAEGKSAQKSAAKKAAAAKSAEKKSPVKKPVDNPALNDFLTKAKRGARPEALEPMLATLTDKPFDAPGWEYEVKWDGYRAVAYCDKDEVELLSRNKKSFNEKFYPIPAALQALSFNAVFDGEVIVADENGMANFGRLQNWRSEADGSLLYYVFDILWYEGKNLMPLPLHERREILKAVLPESENILLSRDFETNGLEFFEAAEKMGLEGIMAKRTDSAYLPGARTTDWLKVKTALRQEVVIGGFTKNEGTAKQFSSLLVGVYDGKQLRYTGKIGTGFNDKTQRDMMKQFTPLIIGESPFDVVPDINKPSRFRPTPPEATATWLKPELVCEVSYRELTSDGVMRHPSFQGMRIDKPANAVRLEKEIKTEAVVKSASKKSTEKKSSEKSAAKPAAEKYLKPAPDDKRKTLLNPTDETQVRKVSGHEIKFTNLDKVFWPKEKITKRDLLNYYYRVAPYILPYLKDRPQSMNRFPNGINGKSFYQKDVTGKVPDWIDTVPYENDPNKHFMLCNDEAALLLMANMGCIEMNPWSSTTKKPDNPDWCVIDLDPDKNHFDKVIETALVTKEILEGAGAQTFCKTSGSTGLHIYIPLGKKYPYEASKEFGRLIAQMVHDRLPKFTSIERMTADRRGKLYIDFLQNRPQATLAAAYSVRPKPGATVSMPLQWDEVKKGMRMQDFNIRNAVDRVESMGDIFKPVLGKGIDMKKVLDGLGAMSD